MVEALSTGIELQPHLQPRVLAHGLNKIRHLLIFIATCITVLQSLGIERRDQVLFNFASSIPGIKPHTKYMLTRCLLNGHIGAKMNC